MKNINFGVQNGKYIVKDYCSVNKKYINWCLILLVAFIIIGILLAVWLFDSEKFISVFVIIGEGQGSIFGEFFKYLLMPFALVILLYFSMRKNKLFVIGIILHFIYVALLFFEIAKCFMFMDIACVLFSIFVLIPYAVIYFCISTVLVINTYNYMRAKHCYFVTFSGSYLIYLVIYLVNAILWFLFIFGLLNIFF